MTTVLERNQIPGSRIYGHTVTQNDVASKFLERCEEGIELVTWIWAK
jgi:hypothetical protein